MKNHTKRRGLFASAGALLTAAALALGGAAAANAQDIPAVSNIVITKLTTPPAGPGGAATGMPVDSSALPEGAVPIAGVQFDAYPVPTTATPGTNAWQKEIAGITLAQAQTAVESKPSAHSFTATDASGVTTWFNAPLGLYLIRETSAPAGVTPAGDFLVAVPLTNPQSKNEWLDTIYVYPKNSKVTATKTVNEGSSVAVGQDVTWSVLADIPRDSAISKYEISDTLDTRLTYKPTATVSLSGSGAQTLVACTGANTPANCDYTVSYVAPKLTVTFSDAGRAKLVTEWQERPASQVKLDLTTTVNASALNQTNTAAAAIVNTPVLTVNDADPVNGTPSTLKVGDIKLTKVDSVTDAALPDGKVAKFSVYRTEANAKARTNAIEINGQSIFTTAPGTGDLRISGLFFSNYVNGATVTDTDDYRGYWVNEVEAPEGYQLLAAPVKTTVTEAGTDVTAIKIENVANTNGFVLPLTGGMGTAVLTIGGIAILATVLLVARRRRHSEAHAE